MTKIDKDLFYEATEPLMVGRARAANPGDQVHGSTVLANGWEDQVKALPKSEAPAVTGWWGEGPEPTSVEGITKAVGDDKTRAAAALEAERGKAQPRTTLVEALEKVVAGTEVS